MIKKINHSAHTVLIIILSSLYCNAQTTQAYTSFNSASYNLYKWEGSKTIVLSSSNTLNPTVMTNWVNAMDGTYNYYYSCTNQYPTCFTNVTCINGKTTIARVDATCGAGCGYLGWTGIELLNTYFDTFYNSLLINNQYSQEPFYEFGRNFWFYDTKLKYQTNDPIVTGYAVFMRFMAIDYLGLQGADFGNLTFPQFQTNVKGLLTSYMADPNLNWNNTLALGQGITGSGLGATDLFASFCFYLKENYGGHTWVQNVWKFAGQRPDAITTQDAVDNFIIASSEAANTNLTSLFQSWKWTPSTSAIAYLNLTVSVTNLNQENQTNIFYPNPTKGLLFFNTKYKSIKIYSQEGKILGNYTPENSIDISNLPKGIYIIDALTVDNKRKKTKILKD